MADETKTATLSLAKKLSLVMVAIDHVEKRGLNKFQNYKYVRASDVAHAVRSELTRLNVFMSSTVIDKRYYTILVKEGVQQAVDLHIHAKRQPPPGNIQSDRRDTRNDARLIYFWFAGSLAAEWSLRSVRCPYFVLKRF